MVYILYYMWMVFQGLILCHEYENVVVWNDGGRGRSGGSGRYEVYSTNNNLNIFIKKLQI